MMCEPVRTHLDSLKKKEQVKAECLLCGIICFGQHSGLFEFIFLIVQDKKGRNGFFI